MSEEKDALAQYAADDVTHTGWLADRIRLTACLTILEKLNTTFDQFPELTDLTTKRGRALTNLKHDAQRELLRAWRKGAI